MKKKLLILALITALILTISISVAAETAKNGGWLVTAGEDPLTDEFTLYIYSQYSEKDQYNVIGLRRKEGKTNLILQTDYLGNDHLKDLIYRFDQEELVETKWGIASSSSSLFFKEDQDTLKSFVKKNDGT
jgi:hypothetical protein